MTKGQVADTIPVYFVRYEDLLIDPVPVLEELFCFLLEVPSVEGTVVQKRIRDSASKGTESKAVYKLKSNTKNFNKNEKNFSPENRLFVQENLSEYIYYFGYASHPEEENPTDIFKFGDGEGMIPHDPALL